MSCYSYIFVQKPCFASDILSPSPCVFIHIPGGCFIFNISKGITPLAVAGGWRRHCLSCLRPQPSLPNLTRRNVLMKAEYSVNQAELPVIS